MLRLPNDKTIKVNNRYKNETRKSKGYPSTDSINKPFIQDKQITFYWVYTENIKKLVYLFMFTFFL